jgi:transcriptional regulator with XRE-family HTH domain
MNEFGRRLDMSKDQIAAYESGRALPQAPTIIRVCEMAGISNTEFLNKKISKEEIVKEMFVVLNNATETTGSDQTIAELRKVIEAMQSTITAQLKVIELQGKMTEQFMAMSR